MSTSVRLPGPGIQNIICNSVIELGVADVCACFLKQSYDEVVSPLYRAMANIRLLASLC